jgi:hypothetical protein
MHVARVRQKLAEYYRTEGVDDPVVVDIPKGAFEVTFEPREVAVEQFSVVATEEVASVEPKRRKETILIGLMLVAAVCAVIFGVQLWRMKTVGTDHRASANLAGATPELQQLWEPILATDRPLMICLAASNGSTGAGTASGAFLMGQFLADRKNNVLLTDSDQTCDARNPDGQCDLSRTGLRKSPDSSSLHGSTAGPGARWNTKPES